MLLPFLSAESSVQPCPHTVPIEDPCAPIAFRVLCAACSSGYQSQQIEENKTKTKQKKNSKSRAGTRTALTITDGRGSPYIPQIFVVDCVYSPPDVFVAAA